MAKKRYTFNQQTGQFEPITLPFRMRFYRLFRKLIFGFIFASVINLAFSYFFYTPKMYAIIRNNNELLVKYNILNDKITSASMRLNEIRQRDINVYRSLFAADTTHIKGAYTPYSDSKYAHLRDDNYENIMADSWLRLDDLARRLYLESKSLDDLQTLSKNKELMAEAIPAIWPVDRTKIKKHIGSFGSRLHPIYKRIIPHKGIDFGGQRGLPIYATGNGKIESVKTMYGYGRQILIDHGFGYKTRYAHLNKIDVVMGQTVKRGEKIGEMGNTGRSTGPHLHYEVIYMNRHVDPINYFSRDMSEEEFAKIVESASATTYETN